MTLVGLITASIAAALVSFSLTPVTIRLAHKIGALDRPAERKVHQRVIARLGGLAVIAGTVVGVWLWSLADMRVAHRLEVESFWLALIVGVLPILTVSFIDDIRPVRASTKFLVQNVGAIAAVALGIRLGTDIHLFDLTLPIGWVAIPLSVLWIVGVTNAFNIVDGLDGLSAGLALISAISLGAVSVVARRPDMAAVAFVIAGALIGFLPFNIHPAKVFLGDTGSAAIGFALACLALRGGATLSAGMAILVPIVVLGVPLAETMVSIARRTVRSIESKSVGIFDADRGHFHHQLLSLGLSHRQAVFVLYAAGGVFAACAVASVFLTHKRAAVLLVSLIMAAFVALRKLGYHEFAFVRRGTVLKAYDAPVLRSAFFATFLDVAIVVAALYAALVLKYDDWSLTDHRSIAQGMLPLVVACFVFSLTAFGVYRGSWRMATIEDLMRPIAGSMTASVCAYLIGSLIFQPAPSMSLHLIFTILAIGLIAGSRASYRLLRQMSLKASNAGERVLIYGAGRGGSMLLREAIGNPAMRINPVAFIDDDSSLNGRHVNGVPVVGSLDSMETMLEEYDAAGVIVSSDKIPADSLARVRDLCLAQGKWVRRFEIGLHDDRRSAHAVDSLAHRASSMLPDLETTP